MGFWALHNESHYICCSRYWVSTFPNASIWTSSRSWKFLRVDDLTGTIYIFAILEGAHCNSSNEALSNFGIELAASNSLKYLSACGCPFLLFYSSIGEYIFCLLALNNFGNFFNFKEKNKSSSKIFAIRTFDFFLVHIAKFCYLLVFWKFYFLQYISSIKRTDIIFAENSGAW